VPKTIVFTKEKIMGNTAGVQCPVCKSWDVDGKYNGAYRYYECNQCGDKFN
jgi:DNA-directed RNA polymerase subunit RPC12/RpoP